MLIGVIKTSKGFEKGRAASSKGQTELAKFFKNMSANLENFDCLLVANTWGDKGEVEERYQGST